MDEGDLEDWDDAGSAGAGTGDDSEPLINFMEITGADQETAVRYLVDIAAGNLETAIMLFMESGGDSMQQPRLAPPAPETRAPIPARSQVLAFGGMGDYDDEMMQIHGTRLPQPTRHFGAVAASSSQVTAADMGTGDEWKNERLSKMFQPPTDLMYKGTFAAARTHAQQAHKWLMVTVHDPSEFACQKMNRDLWGDETVKTMIKDSFIFMWMHNASSHGMDYSNLYRIERYPYISVIDPLTGELVWKSHTITDITDFFTEVMDLLDRKKFTSIPTVPEPGVTSSLYSKSRKGKGLSDDDQMRMAMVASLGEAQLVKGSSGDVVVIDDEADDQISIFNRIDSANYPEPDSTADATRIQFRFPNGQKVVRKFSKTDKVFRLFQFVKAEFPDIAKQPFDLVNMRDPLLARSNESLQEANCANASLSLDYIQ